MSSLGTECVTTTAIRHGRVTAQCDTDRWEAEVSSLGTECVTTTAICHGRVTAQCDTDRWEAVTDGRQKCHHLGQNPLQPQRYAMGG